MKSLLAKILFVLCVAMCVGCKVERPDDVIAPEKMESLLYDYHLAQAVTEDEMPSSYKKKMHINYVFEKHGVTKEAFDSSLVWYTRYPKHLVRIYSNLEERLDDEMEKMGVITADDDAFLAQMAGADMVNLWRGSQVKLLSSMALCNRLNFEYKADDTYVQGDSISFSFSAKHLASGLDSVKFNAHAALVVEYADASTAVNGTDVTDDGAYVVAVERNFGSKITALHGFLFYSDDDSLSRPKLLLGDIAVMRVHPSNSK